MTDLVDDFIERSRMLAFKKTIREKERMQLIATAATLHAAVIMSPDVPGEIFTSVNEAAELIAECDKWLAAKYMTTEEYKETKK